MKVSGIDCHVLLDADFDQEATSACQDALVVEVHTDEGITGIGEAEVNPWIGRACIEAPGAHSMARGLAEMLIGVDPTDPTGVWDELYGGSILSGRRGALICALGAVDLAFGPYAHQALNEPDERTTKIVAACREAAGDDFVLMVDDQYAFGSTERALRTIESWTPYDVYFVETPLWTDDLAAYADLADVSPIPAAAGEILTTRHEFVDFIDRGAVDIPQPCVTRVGGLTEARRVCNYAAEKGPQVVPHAWHTGIAAAATAHLRAATPNMPYFEFFAPDRSEPVLRKVLVHDEVKLVDGEMRRPTKPGLGVELDRDALERFTRAAEDAFDAGRLGPRVR